MFGVKDTPLRPLGFQQITDVSASTALTVPNFASMALIQCTAQNVRWRDDGTDPIATVGMLIYAGDIGFWYTGDLAAIRFIEAAATAVLNVSYYK